MTKRLIILLLILIFPCSAAPETRAINDPKDGWLNTRSGPGTSYKIIDRLYNGQGVYVYETQGNWIKVRDFLQPEWVYKPYTTDARTFLKKNIGKYDVKTLSQVGRFCNAYVFEGTKTSRNLCRGTFKCGDGGCDPIGIGVVIEPSRLNELIAFTQSLNITGFIEADECRKKYIFLHIEYYENAEIYCLASVPGYEIENTLRLRANKKLVLDAYRSGGLAGLPESHIIISEKQFARYRGAGISELRLEVIKAIEQVTNEKCTTNNRRTCTILPQSGKLVIDLLTPSTPITGRTGFWEKSYWEVYVSSRGGGSYELYFNVPITAIKRWPTSGTKPGKGFTSVDYDEGFESLRALLMEKVAFSLGGTIPEEFQQ